MLKQERTLEDALKLQVANDNCREFPTLPANVEELLPCEIEIVFTDSEHEAIEATARFYGLSSEEYVRRVSLDYRLPETPIDRLHKCLFQIETNASGIIPDDLVEKATRLRSLLRNAF